jgi:hypothetical protein
MRNKNPEVIVAGYRRAADLIEAHPHIAAPIVTSKGDLIWSLWAWDCPDGVPAMVAAIRRAVGGKWTKHERAGLSEPEMEFKRDGYSIIVKREAVCVRRVVGTETITKPAVSLPERTETREIVEWDCEPVLAESVAS